MTTIKTLAAVLVATTVLGGAAYAADQAAPATTKQAAVEKTVDKDVGRLSTDGAQAFRDVQATRFAIFNAEPKEAKTLIDKAKAELQKAAKDDAVFMKAESELQNPVKGDKAKAATDDVTQKVAWLPVDSQLALGEDFQATPEKIAAVTEANKSLQNKDRGQAFEKLKLADVDVEVTTAVLPLQKTTADVDKAADMIGQDKFYEANALLKDATDRMRIDIVDIYGQPYTPHQKTAEHKATDQKADAKVAAGKAAPETPAKTAN